MSGGLSLIIHSNPERKYLFSVRLELMWPTCSQPVPINLDFESLILEISWPLANMCELPGLLCAKLKQFIMTTHHTLIQAISIKSCNDNFPKLSRVTVGPCSKALLFIRRIMLCREVVESDCDFWCMVDGRAISAEAELIAEQKLGHNYCAVQSGTALKGCLFRL